MTLLGILFWSFTSGFALGILDALSFSPAWRWLMGG